MQAPLAFVVFNHVLSAANIETINHIRKHFQQNFVFLENFIDFVCWITC